MGDRRPDWLVTVISEDVARAGHEAYEAKARELGHVSGSPVPWDEVPEPYRSCTLAAYEAVLIAHEMEQHMERE